METVLSFDVESFKNRILKRVKENNSTYEKVKNIPATVLFNSDFALVDRLVNVGDVNFCNKSNQLFIA